MMRLIFAVILPLGIACCLPSKTSAPSNVAYGQPYSIDPPANYGTATGDHGTELTDGDASGPYWRNGTSVGWSWRSPIVVKVDLEQPVPVSKIRVQAGAKTSGGIYFPSQIIAFGGDGSGNYGLLGATKLTFDHESPEDPALRKFDIDFPARIISDLVVVAFKRRKFTFLGEIEAISAAEGDPLDGSLASLDAVRDAAIRYRQDAVEALPQPKPTGPDLARRWAMPLSGDTEASAPNAHGDTACRIERVDPWPETSGVETTIPEETSLVSLIGARDYALFRVVNRSDDAVEVSLHHPSPKADLEITSHALGYVQALDYSWVPDVVLPFERGLLPPHTAMLVLSQVTPHAAGDTDAEIAIGCGEEGRRFEIPMVALESEPGISALNGNLWTYLHGRDHAPIANALSCDPHVLDDFGIDTAIVHPSALVDTGGPRPTELLRRYFRSHTSAERLLLFMAVDARPWAFLNMPEDKAADALASWWAWVRKIAEEENVEGEIVLYPVDEPKLDEVNTILRTRRLAEDAGITARFYATVEHDTAEPLRSLDILQVLRPTEGLLSLLNGAEVHSYNTRQDGRNLSVNGYYRRQGWDAFELGLSGVGFWAAWAGSGIDDPATGWSPFTGKSEIDFAILYSLPDGCALPSRRVLAWKRGIEENRLLRQCAASFPGGTLESRVRDAIKRGTPSGMTDLLIDAARLCR